jgi:hypothetical protein
MWLDPRNPRYRTGILLLDTLILAVLTLAWLVLWAVAIVWLVVFWPIWLPIKIVRGRRGRKRLDERVAHLTVDEYEALLNATYAEFGNRRYVEALRRSAERVRPGLERDLTAKSRQKHHDEAILGIMRQNNPELFDDGA